MTLDYLTLPALQQFQILALQTEQLAAILLGALEPIEYSRIINLFRRSECGLTELTFSVPVPVDSFLLPILRQSPALQKSDIFVDAEIAGDVFRALTLVDGNVHVPNLKILRVMDVPCPGAPALCGLLQEADALQTIGKAQILQDNIYGVAC